MQTNRLKARINKIFIKIDISFFLLIDYKNFLNILNL